MNNFFVVLLEFFKPLTPSDEELDLTQLSTTKVVENNMRIRTSIQACEAGLCELEEERNVGVG